MRDGVDGHRGPVVPPGGLRNHHLFPLQPFLCVPGEGGCVCLEDPQVLPPGELDQEVLLHQIRDRPGDTYAFADAPSLAVAYIDKPLLSSFAYAHDRLSYKPRGHALGRRAREASPPSRLGAAGLLAAIWPLRRARRFTVYRSYTLPVYRRRQRKCWGKPALAGPRRRGLAASLKSSNQTWTSRSR